MGFMATMEALAFPTCVKLACLIGVTRIKTVGASQFGCVFALLTDWCRHYLVGMSVSILFGMFIFVGRLLFICCADVVDGSFEIVPEFL
jgi:hypothetical protein